MSKLPFFLLLVLLAACAPPTVTPTGPGTPEAIYTSAAETMMAQLTLSAGGTAVAQLTQIAAQPTLAAPLATPLPTSTATWTATSPPPSPTSPSLPCEAAELIGDVTTANGAVFFPGSVFAKVWRVRNAGSCAWTPDYALVFSGGDLMGAITAVYMPRTIAPGEQVDLQVSLTAPQNPGLYRSEWLLRSPSGALFGVGSGAAFSLTVQMQVVRPPSPVQGVYDFAARACDASWRSSVAALGCPGSTDDPNGSVVLLNRPYLESGFQVETVLWTRPDVSPKGYISGLYPAYTVRPGDRFRAELGCLRDSPSCDVAFRLEYRTADGTQYSLGAWRETYDGSTTLLDVDLSDLSGATVQFALIVENRSRALDSGAAWLSPYVQSSASQAGPVLVWNQQGGPDDVCEELRVTLGGQSRGEAVARSCEGRGRELGSGSLTSSELDQLLGWVSQLASFDAELFNADQGEPLTAYITFNGRGANEAQNAHILALQTFAERLFHRVTR